MQMFRTATSVLLCSVAIAWTALESSAASPGVEVVYSFVGSSVGANSTAALIQGSDGNFYGTTSAGGAFNSGTVFRTTASGVTTLLYAFTGGADGASPKAALIQTTDGSFYGTTYSGGAWGRGTIFKIDAGLSRLTTIHAFAGGAGAGANPQAALLQARDGSLYGTTELGGLANRGTLFRLTGPSVKVLYTFTGGLDGAYPYAPLIQGTDGNFYGTTYSGDLQTFGRVFKMTPAGVVTVMHTFLSGTDGAAPTAGLVQVADGSFYGATTLGGTANKGTVFKMNAAGTFGWIYSFTGGVDGSSPGAALMQSADGVLYGTAKVGAAAYGTVFTMTSAGAFGLVYRFTGGIDGAVPYAGLIQDATGRLYGTTGYGGQFDAGAVFRLPVTHVFTAPAPTVTGIALSAAPTGGRTSVTITGTGFAAGATVMLGKAPATSVVVQSATSITATTPAHAAGAVTVAVTNLDLQRGMLPNGFTYLAPRAGNFETDRKSDIAVFRPAGGNWYVRYSSNGYSIPGSNLYQWGLPGDLPVAADFDGDGQVDLTVWRPSEGNWYIRYSSLGYNVAYDVVQWGLPGDIPLAVDLDGDGRTELTVFRPSNGTWYIRYSSLGYSVQNYDAVQWGLPGDIPVVGDFDGDGKTELSVFRPSYGGWFIRYSSTDYATANYYQWGLPGDVPLAGDFDGDGKSDLGVFRPSYGGWFIRLSSRNYSAGDSDYYQWGLPGDVPMAADFDGDGKTELSVFRPSTGVWFIRYSSQGYSLVTAGLTQWGLTGDIPLLKP
jgi:uncharacterized repeat protein (TIGR03803 family)